MRRQLKSDLELSLQAIETIAIMALIRELAQAPASSKFSMIPKSLAEPACLPNPKLGFVLTLFCSLGGIPGHPPTGLMVPFRPPLRLEPDSPVLQIPVKEMAPSPELRSRLFGLRVDRPAAGSIYSTVNYFEV